MDGFRKLKKNMFRDDKFLKIKKAKIQNLLRKKHCLPLLYDSRLPATNKRVDEQFSSARSPCTFIITRCVIKS